MTSPPVAELPAAPVPADGARTGRRRLLVSGLAAVLLAAAGGGWALTSAEPLQPVGSRLEVPMVVGEVLTIGLFARPVTGAVDVVAATPRVVSNTADADLRVLLCRWSAEPVGAARGSADEVCDEVAPAAGAVLRAASTAGAGLVLEVTPRRAGAVHVEGVRLEHRSGLRRVSGVSGTSAIARVREAPAG